MAKRRPVEMKRMYAKVHTGIVTGWDVVWKIDGKVMARGSLAEVLDTAEAAAEGAVVDIVADTEAPAHTAGAHDSCQDRVALGQVRCSDKVDNARSERTVRVPAQTDHQCSSFRHRPSVWEGVRQKIDWDTCCSMALGHRIRHTVSYYKMSLTCDLRASCHNI